MVPTNSIEAIADRIASLAQEIEESINRLQQILSNQSTY